MVQLPFFRLLHKSADSETENTSRYNSSANVLPQTPQPSPQSIPHPLKMVWCVQPPDIVARSEDRFEKLPIAVAGVSGGKIKSQYSPERNGFLKPATLKRNSIRTPNPILYHETAPPSPDPMPMRKKYKRAPTLNILVA